MNDTNNSADSLASAGGVEVVAWWNTKWSLGATIRELSEHPANVGAIEETPAYKAGELEALVRQSDHLAALSKEREVADGLRAELEAVKRDAKAISRADVSKAARFICDRSAKEMGIDKDDNWKLYGSEYIEDVTDMLKHIGFAIEAAKEG